MPLSTNQEAAFLYSSLRLFHLKELEELEELKEVISRQVGLGVNAISAN